MKAYDKYKDSGVEWLGKIPEHWEEDKGKWLFEKMEREVLKDYEIITCFRDGEVTLRKNRRENGFTNALKEIGYQGVFKGDLVIHQMDAFAGAIGVSNANGKSTPVYSVCSPRFDNVNNYYYAYLLRSMALAGLITSLAKGIRERSTDFRFTDFSNLLYPIPPLQEQKAIATFLDEKCGKIDEAISIKEKQIALLKEHRQIIIQEAVTKGLDKNVKLKGSGVDWIGEIPEHWEVKRLKELGEIKNGATPSSNILEFWDGDIIWVTPKDISNSKYISTSERKISKKGYLSCGTNLVPKGTIVLTTRAPIGKVSIALEKLCTNQGCKSIVIKKEINNQYLYNLLSISVESLKSLGTGTTFMELSNNNVKNFILPLPSKIEQQQIVDYLEEQTSKIDKAIGLKTEQIEKLKLYKQSLINEVVTGKVRVS